MTSTTTAYCDIVKYERNADGDLLVTGRATGPDLDLDRQICDPAWLKEAVPEWYRTGANVREMHASIAAGRGDELVQNGDGWDLRSIVVDPVSAKKVEKQILRGYSIGIRNPQVIKDAQAPGGRIVGGQIVEVSLVDRPANPTCQLMLAKALKPGPATTVGAVDAERHLVKVEELHDRTGEPLAALKALDLVAVVKGDQARDIRDADQAIAIIAGLIQAEAACLADGVASEACDIDLLLSAIRALEWFKCREKKESTVAHVVEMAAEATAEKSAAPAPTAAATPAPDAPKAPDTQTPPPPVEKAAEGEQKTDLTELVKAAVAEAVAPIQAQLAKAMNAPAPGGPVLTRTTEDTTKAAAREIHLAKAEHYDRLAYEVTDPQARAGYLQMAADERATATS